MFLVFYLLFAAIITAAISGAFGMAGGVLFLASLTPFFTVPVIMILHAATQLTSNSSRAWLWREHIEWSKVWKYAIGALCAASIFWVFSYVPSKMTVFIGLGVVAWLGTIVPQARGFNFDKPFRPFLAGLLVTSTQLFVGGAGPVIDLFFLHCCYDKNKVMGTKGFVYGISHFVKLGYFSSVLLGSGQTMPVSMWVIIGCIGLTYLGTLVGKSLMQRLTEAQFRFYGSWLLRAVGTIFIIKACGT